MELVEHLGSGMQRILKSYDANIFHVSEHFFEIRFPMDARALEMIEETTAQPIQVTAQVGTFCQQAHSAKEIMEELGLKHWKTFQQNYLKPLLEVDFIEMTIPNKPQSRLQKYQLTSKGRQWMDLQKRS